jgi:short-subunit dehydrogenase
MKTVWIIGGTEGIGLSVARKLQASGVRVTISARSEQRLDELNRQEGFTTVRLDATRSDEIRHAVEQLFAGDDRPDTVLINIGDYEPMPIEAYDSGLFERMNEINYLAPVRLLEHLLPAMRDHGGGYIWVNGSLAAYRGLPRSAPYSASKAAVVSLVECLVAEARQWEIHLGIINHGFVKTRLTDKNDFDMPMIVEPEQAAEHIVHGMQKRKYEITFPRMFTFWMRVLRVLPNPLYIALTRKMVTSNASN